MRGRKPKPASALKLHGTYREDRHGDRGGNDGGAELPCPATLDADGAWLWSMVTGCRKDWLAESDAVSLQVCCEMWSAYRRLWRLWSDDLTDKNLRCSAIAAKAEWEKTATRFGLSPVDRARLGRGVESGAGADELEDMLA